METMTPGERSRMADRAPSSDNAEIDKAFEQAGWGTNEQFSNDPEFQKLLDEAWSDGDELVDNLEEESNGRLQTIENSLESDAGNLPGLGELRAERDGALAANSDSLRETVGQQSSEARAVIDSVLADGVDGNEEKLAEIAVIFPNETADAINEAPLDDTARQAAIDAIQSHVVKAGVSRAPSPETFSRKLYLARNIEGKPNTKEIAELRKLEAGLGNQPDFVSVAPFGSVFRGYGNETSDIDTYVLYDSADDKPGPELEAAVKGWEAGAESGGQEKHAIFQNVNPERIIRDLKAGAAAGDPGEHVATVLSNMTRLTTGDKINGYREAIRTAINELPEEQRQQVKADILDALVRKDTLGLAKRKRRLPGFSDTDHQDVMRAREEMWRKRVESIWG
jgi:hypothetical protein